MWTLVSDIDVATVIYGRKAKKHWLLETYSTLPTHPTGVPMNPCNSVLVSRVFRVRECSLVSSKTVIYQYNFQYTAEKCNRQNRNKLSASTLLPVQHQQFLGFCFTVPLQKPPHTHEHVFLIRKRSRKDHLPTKDTFLLSLSGCLTDRF